MHSISSTYVYVSHNFYKMAVKVIQVHVVKLPNLINLPLNLRYST